jgi:hypothetical protein
VQAGAVFTNYLTPGALAGAPGDGGVELASEAAPIDGVAVLLPVVLELLLPVLEGVVVVEGVVTDGLVEGDAPVSSTFLPQAPSASKAAKATAVRAAGLNLDASMSVSFYE